MPQERLRKWNVHEGGLSSVSGSLGAGYVEIGHIRAINMSGAVMYLQVFDTGSLPSVDDVPRRSYGVQANSVLEIDLREGRDFHTGAVYSWSSEYGLLATGSFTQLDVEIEYRNS